MLQLVGNEIIISNKRWVVIQYLFRKLIKFNIVPKHRLIFVLVKSIGSLFHAKMKT